MNFYSLPSEQLASAIFGGFASQEFLDAYTQGWQVISAGVERVVNAVKSGVAAATKLASQGWEFLKGWFKDDPVGATAGVVAAGLALGVVLVVGGSVVGALGGTLSTLGAIGKFVMSPLGTFLTGLGTTAIIGTLIRFAIRGVQHIWSFNWNVTDKQLAGQQKELIKRIYGLAGNAVGSSLASLLCGAAPAKLIERSNIVKVNPMVLAKIKEATEFNPNAGEVGELYEEMLESIKALLRGVGNIAAQYFFIESYKNIRKWIKNYAKNGGKLIKIFPGLDKVIAKWGEEGSKSWSFASATEEAIESIKDENIRAFTEEAVEQFMDVCTENLMVISYVF